MQRKLDDYCKSRTGKCCASEPDTDCDGTFGHARRYSGVWGCYSELFEEQFSNPDLTEACINPDGESIMCLSGSLWNGVQCNDRADSFHADIEELIAVGCKKGKIVDIYR